MKLLDRHLFRLLEPALRPDVIAVVGALAVVFAVKFENGAPAAGVPILCGIAGLLLRWTAMPIFFLITLCYFSLFPIGLPVSGFNRLILRDSYFRMDDLILAAAVIIYLHAQYRIFSFTQHSVSAGRRAQTVEAAELPRLIGVVVVAVVIGQLLWLLFTNIEVHFGTDGLLRMKPSTGDLLRKLVAPSTQSAEMNRLLIFVGFGAGVVAVLGFAFWYWRVLTLSKDEAQLILLDTAWRADRREYARLETWRAARLGHLAKPHANIDRIFRVVVRVLVLSILFGSLAWVAYIYRTYP